MSVIRTIGNVIWFIIGGWLTALCYLILGALCCITIIGIPIGKACFQYAKLMAFPFGKTIVKETFIKGKENVSGVRKFFGVLANILWLPFGIVMFFTNIVAGLAAFVTIVGIPLAFVIFKSAYFIIWPIGAKVISEEEKQAILNAQAEERVIQRLQASGMVVGASANINGQIGGNMNAAMGAVQQNVAAGAAAVGGAFAQAGSTLSQYGQQSVGYAQSVCDQNNQRVRSVDKKMKWNEIMQQVEAALYRNQVVGTCLSFLHFFAIGFAVLCVIIGIIGNRSLLGFFTGLASGGIVFVLLGILFIVQQKYILSAITFWGTAAANLLSVISTIIIYNRSGYTRMPFLRAGGITGLIEIAVCVVFGLIAFLSGKD